MSRINKILIFIGAILFFLTPNKTLALTISPTKILLTTDSPSAEETHFFVFNEGDEAVFISPDVLNVEQNLDGNFNFKKDNTEEKSWVKIESESFLLFPNQKKEIKVSIKIPENVYPGSYYFGLAANVVNDKDNGVGLSKQLVSLLHLQVAGIAKENLRVVDFLSKKNIYLKNDFNFKLSLRNAGNVEIPFGGDVSLKSFFGRLIAKNNVENNNKILPDILREFTFDFYNQPIKLPGIYRAELNLNYGLTGQILKVKTSFWYFPVWSLATFIILLFGLFIFVWKIKKRW